MTLLMIQMVIMIMIRRVILQRVNVRMNCINCSLETNELKMKMQDIESKVYNCHLFWWKSSSSAGRYMNLGKLVITYFAVPVTSAPSEHIWSQAARVLTFKRNRMKEDVTAAMIYDVLQREQAHSQQALHGECEGEDA